MKLAYARPARRSPTPPPEAPKKPGPKPKLSVSPQLLQQIKGCGEIGATVNETATVLGVSERTLQKLFADYPETKEAHENGLNEVRMSIRRQQIEAAKKGNPVMLIWLGKQLLGQKDKQEFGIGGNGQPVETLNRIELVIIDPPDPSPTLGLIQAGNARPAR